MGIPAKTIENAARVAHEANRAYCECLGDTSQVPWTEAPEWQKESARDGVRKIAADAPVAAEEMHANWVYHKLAAGWTYGEAKDPDKKQHPNMVAFRDLPITERLKDELFLATVTALLWGAEDPEL